MDAVGSASAFVLAGGKSSRMGRPNALLRLGNEPLISHIARALKPDFDDIVVAAAPEQELPVLPARLVRMKCPFRGPSPALTMARRPPPVRFAWLLLAMRRFSFAFNSFASSRVWRRRRCRSFSGRIICSPCTRYTADRSWLCWSRNSTRANCGRHSLRAGQDAYRCREGSARLGFGGAQFRQY
jgi:hypothetical protein